MGRGDALTKAPFVTAICSGTLLLISCGGGGTESLDPAALFAEWASLAQSAEQQDTIVVDGREGWLFFGPELRHLGVGKFWGDAAVTVSKARRPEWADPLPAILDFHKQLSEVDVELVIVPVPPKSIIYPDKIPSTVELGPTLPPRLDIHHQKFYELLRESGVTVLDLTPLFLSNRDHPNGPLYCRHDTHWSGVATVLAAEQIIQEEPTVAIQDEWRTVEIAGDLWRALAHPVLAKERLSLRFVGKVSDDILTPVEPDPSSPVVLLGDSHTLVFHAGDDMHAVGAGLADQLARELGFAVDLVGVRGSGATASRINLLRRAQQTPDYWATKKLVIWCFAAREFTESDGWRIVPISS